MSVIRQQENDAFRTFVRNRNAATVDALVQEINSEVEAGIDCTQCGACCKGLMINVTEQETVQAASGAGITTAAFKERYIEESAGGQMVINTIPCHFLSDNKCSIYADRFAECRAFPHLNKPNFADRMFGTLMHYSICPIVYNVVEQLKIKLDFFSDRKEA